MNRKLAQPTTFQTNARFGHLVIESRAGLDLWNCRCDCGSLTALSSAQLEGDWLDCRSDLHVPGARRTAGASRSNPLELSSWQNMWQRCTAVNNPRYKDYGGRGIRIDPRWWVFPNFLEDMGRRSSKRYSLERCDPDGGYDKANCCWALRSREARNQRRSIFVEYKGRQWHLAELCRRHSVVEYGTLYRRVRQGWSIEEALTTPAGPWALRKHFDAAKSAAS